MKKDIFLIICCLISSFINSQELPSLNLRVDLSQFCGSEYDANGYQIRLYLGRYLFPLKMKEVIYSEAEIRLMYELPKTIKWN